MYLRGEGGGTEMDPVRMRSLGGGKLPSLAKCSVRGDRSCQRMCGGLWVRIPTLPPLILIKALIFRGFFVSVRFWSPIWSPIISVAYAGLLRIVMDIWPNDSRLEGSDFSKAA